MSDSFCRASDYKEYIDVTYDGFSDDLDGRLVGYSTSFEQIIQGEINFSPDAVEFFRQESDKLVDILNRRKNEPLKDVNVDEVAHFIYWARAGQMFGIMPVIKVVHLERTDDPRCELKYDRTGLLGSNCVLETKTTAYFNVLCTIDLGEEGQPPPSPVKEGPKEPKTRSPRGRKKGGKPAPSKPSKERPRPRDKDTEDEEASASAYAIR